MASYETLSIPKVANAPVSPEDPAIPSLLNILDSSLVTLDEMVKMLVSRISPVLDRRVSEESDGAKPGLAGSSPLATTLQNFIFRVHAETEALQNARMSLEI